MNIILNLCARIMGKRSHRNIHERKLARTRQMRRELGLPEHPALRGA